MSAVSAAEFEEAAPLFSALGDPTRLRLLSKLSKGGLESISSLSGTADCSRQAITKHLTVLSNAGLICGHRRGREHLWKLEPHRLDQARSYLDAISRQWDDALERLQTFVEN